MAGVDDVAVDMVVVVDRACVVMTKMLVNVSGFGWDSFSVVIRRRKVSLMKDICHHLRPPRKTPIPPTLWCLPLALSYRDVVRVRQVPPRPQIRRHLHGAARTGNNPMGWHHGWFTATRLLAKINTNCLFSSKSVPQPESLLHEYWFVHELVYVVIKAF